MEKKTIPPATGPPRAPATPDRRRGANDRDRPLLDGAPAHVLHSFGGSAPTMPQPHIRGRRYRIGPGDGFIGIWHLGTGERVATFMEDATASASQRFTELEDARSVTGAASRAWAFGLDHWYLIAVVILGGLTVAYLKSEDPALSRTSSSTAPLAVRPEVAAATANLGFAVAERLTTTHLSTPPTPPPHRPGSKRIRAHAEPRNGASASVGAAPSTPPSVSSGGASTGHGAATGGDAGAAGDGGSTDPSSGGGGPPAGATGPHTAPDE
jgi:hypothetical protein